MHTSIISCPVIPPAPSVRSAPATTERVAARSQFLAIIAQGRSGSTLILRMLNAVPGVRICGENLRAFDHLRSFQNAFQDALGYQRGAFGRLAWALPCNPELITKHLQEMVRQVFDPMNDLRFVGFKEIRYGQGTYGQFVAELTWLRQLMPGIRFILNTRATKEIVRSAWWAERPLRSVLKVRRMANNFHRYVEAHPDHSFLLPYEELRSDSLVLRRMFSDYLRIPWADGCEEELRKIVR